METIIKNKKKKKQEEGKAIIVYGGKGYQILG